MEGIILPLSPKPFPDKTTKAVWTRFFPLVKDLQRMLHEEKIIGEIRRLFVDFSIPKDMPSLQPTRRYKDLSLGGGALLDIGVYPLMWSNIVSTDTSALRLPLPKSPL